MAKDKQSFVLYTDLIHTVRKMPEDKVGKLFLTILEYVNDQNPQVDDMVVDLVFEPIKRQLKRDLKKYEHKKKMWSKAGKRSAELRKENKRQQTLTNVGKRSTDSTVNVNVNDTVNVNNNKGVVAADNWHKDHKKREDVVAGIMKTTGFTSKEVLDYMDEFYLNLTAEGVKAREYSEFSKHFLNFVKKKQRIVKDQKPMVGRDGRPLKTSYI